ncbi:GNAT family N-acetyltransferase [Limibacter armeniacum]|uniref:GNAT family N-acetyltransferase n=1 Tax=Limibacter armeniacum TaxID=466084 RepID=UPI002FE61CF9
MDMLVRLYDLPSEGNRLSLKATLQAEGIEVRRAIAPEMHLVVEWVNKNFNPHWGSEVMAAFANNPTTCLIAIEKGEIQGFACYEATAKAFFGPTGVSEKARGKGIGKLLLLEALNGLKALGYAYGIIGGVGPVEFYQKAVGAILIEGSTPGIYKNMLR